MKISVALCTYNGGRYLDEQLRSIAFQTRIPDEIVINDDGSTDETVSIISNFQQQTFIPVSFQQNPTNLGSTRNFANVIERCTGDVIALSDQDDVWNQGKLQRVEDVFLQSPDISAVLSNAEIVDENLHLLGFDLWKSVGLTPAIQRALTLGNAFELLLQKNYVTGATLAFRSKFSSFLLPIPKYVVHDAWIALLLSAISRISLLDENLVLYRQHPQNQIGARNINILEEINQARGWGGEEIFSKVKALAFVQYRLRKVSSDHEKLKHLRQCIRHWLIRRSIRRSGLKCFPFAAWELVTGRYHCFSKGMRSFLRDIA